MILNQISTGLVAGLVSTGVMSLVEYPIWRKWGVEGVSEWHLNQVMIGRIMHRSPQTVVLQGIILHFLHGGLAGIVFALLLSEVPNIPTFEAGIMFGLLLWIIALIIMRPVTGVEFWHHPLGLPAILVSLFGHILYGMFLGLVMMCL